MLLIFISGVWGVVELVKVVQNYEFEQAYSIGEGFTGPVWIFGIGLTFIGLYYIVVFLMKIFGMDRKKKGRK